LHGLPHRPVPGGVGVLGHLLLQLRRWQVRRRDRQRVVRELRRGPVWNGVGCERVRGLRRRNLRGLERRRGVRQLRHREVQRGELGGVQRVRVGKVCERDGIHGMQPLRRREVPGERRRRPRASRYWQQKPLCFKKRKKGGGGYLKCPRINNLLLLIV